ncbi:MAG: thiamine pyrophosphate-dependent dehydrogenase E1 component subunit alpha, partial [Verrucomicrobia bacterium]|nr:thiamine pyrophosphate-dependent dehydrogenase E1 component subunit alpha [Verrucomicrobiota bacterium]
MATRTAGALERAPLQKKHDPMESLGRAMLRARLVEDKLASLYRAGRIVGGVYLGRGQEGLSAAGGVSLRKGDVFAPLIRDMAGRLAFGEPMIDAVRTYLGSRLGSMKGRDGNIHRGDLTRGVLPMISHLGAMVSATAGVLLAKRMKGEQGRVGLVCAGDGATSTGSFHEGLNVAAVEKLPLVTVVADNGYAYSTPSERQYACTDLLDRAKGYGVDGHGVDGTDPEACLEVVGRAVERAREGAGPQLVVGRLLRLCGHGEHDDGLYVDAEMKSSSRGRDCLKVMEEVMKARGRGKEWEKWREEAYREVEEAVVKA